MRVVFIHGTGAPGHSAWRAMAPDRNPSEEVRFLGRIPPEDAVGEAVRQAIGALDGGGHVVAAWYGGIAGLRVAADLPEAVTSLTLFEPAAFAIARGRPGVGAHLDLDAPIAARRDDPTATVHDFAPWAALAIDMPLPDVPERVLHKVVAEMRVPTPPWQVPVDPDVVRRVPTLVITGGWDLRYEEVAEALVTRGARHVVLRGHRHRVQDHRRPCRSCAPSGRSTRGLRSGGERVPHRQQLRVRLGELVGGNRARDDAAAGVEP